MRGVHLSGALVLCIGFTFGSVLVSCGAESSSETSTSSGTATSGVPASTLTGNVTGGSTSGSSAGMLTSTSGGTNASAGVGTSTAAGGGANTSATDSTGSTGASNTGVGGASTAAAVTTAGQPTACSFTVNQELSSAIGTVGIVTWSTDLPGIDSAHIDFGLSEAGFTMSAPVDLAAPEYRTLLLGMKGSRDYSFQIVANAGQQTCTSETYTLTTGPVSNSVPTLDRQVMNADAIAPGFFITATGLGGGGGGGGGSSIAFIFDADGDVVWWTPAPNGTGRVRMNWEATDMWMMAVNNGGGGGEVRRVSMDGLDVEPNVDGLDFGHHDFTVMPGGSIVVLMHLSETGGGGGGGGGGCSRIVERTAEGTITDIVSDVSTLYTPAGECHPNAIHYYEADDSFTISDRNPNLFVKFSHSGALQWQFGGNNPLGPHIPGSWQVNHGHQLLDNGNFLFFNNNGQNGSPAREFQLDLDALTATEVWTYSSGITSSTLGDVQRLSNGNTIVTYSNAGTIHEVDADGNLVQSFVTGSLGYTMHRPTLYGPPPRG